MTEGYRELLGRLMKPSVNVDLVRQRLTGVIGVNPGDTICFTLELLHDIVTKTRDATPKWHTIDVVLREVRVNHNGSKVLVIDVPISDAQTISMPTFQPAPRRAPGGLIDGVVA